MEPTFVLCCVNSKAFFLPPEHSAEKQPLATTRMQPQKCVLILSDRNKKATSATGWIPQLRENKRDKRHYAQQQMKLFCGVGVVREFVVTQTNVKAAHRSRSADCKGTCRG